MRIHGRAPLAGDPLSSLLGRLYFADWTAGVTRLVTPWAVTGPAGRLCFYAVVQGQCRLLFDDETTRDCQPGDLVVLPHGTPHILGDSPHAPVVPLNDLDRRPGPIGQNPDATLIHGHCSLAANGIGLLTANLHRVLSINVESQDGLIAEKHLIDTIVAEAQSHRAGWSFVVSRMIQLLLGCTIRAHLGSILEETADAEQDAVRLLAASGDPVIGAAVRAMHERPGAPWTVRMLARTSRISKSAFSDRFREIVGQTPMRYLAELRLDKARELLCECDASITSIATMVGYESPSSFSNTFKRRFGCGPAAYRRKFGRNHLPG